MDSPGMEDRTVSKGTSDLLTEQITAIIAETDGQSIYELKPLYDVIDPEALDALFAPHVDGTSRPVGEVSFHYEGYWVTVSSDGVVELETENR
nr:HalOD1 output domain-containing protein [Haladaptatus salinisoli]